MDIERKFSYKGTINLNQQEIEIFDLFYKFSKTLEFPLTIRVAGGWVRDKLLGLESIDIDFAIDCITGEEFVKRAYEHLQKETSGEIHGFGVTRFNPEKSKNLETAKIQVKGVWIDIVNLRGEIYTQDSRIPEIKIGTPEEDAARRDLTINSLFYNLSTKQVEDFTGKGISDLKEGIIRTPLDPYFTFLDDPLRILRTFRFATRYQFAVQESIFEAAMKENVRHALQTKVSRERVGIELRSILSNENAFEALKYFKKANVFDVLLQFPELKLEEKEQEACLIASNRAFEIANNCYNFFNEISNSEGFTHIEETRLMAYLLSLTLPFRDITFKIKKKDVAVGPLIVKDSIKFTNKEASNIQKCLENCKGIQNTFKSHDQHKLEIIRILRDMGGIWELAFFGAFLDSISQGNQSQSMIDKKLQEYISLKKFVHNEKWAHLHNLKHLFDGKEITEIFGLEKPGPLIKIISDNIFNWQALNIDLGKADLLSYFSSFPEEKARFMV